MRRLLPLLLICHFLAPVSAQTESAPAKLAHNFRPGSGLRVSVGDVPLIRSSSLQVYAPGWKQSYYSSHAERAVVEKSKGTKGVVAKHAARTMKFTATETFETLDEHRFAVTLAGTWHEGLDAQLEWCLGAMNCFPLYGGSVATVDEKARVEIFPKGNEAKQNLNLLPGSGGIRFTSRLGQLTVTIEKGPAELTLLDGRALPLRGWAEDAPSLWLGMIGVALKPHEPFELRAVFTFEPAGAAAPAAAVRVDAGIEKTDRATIATTRPIQVIPKPKHLTWGSGRFLLDDQTALENAPSAAARVLWREVKERFNFELPAKATKISRAIRFVHDQQLRDEGYQVDIAPHGVEVRAKTDRGFFYAAQTLCQLLRSADEGVFLPACNIDDAPSLAFRGVHLFTGKESVPLFTRLAERVLSRYKFNHVVIESQFTQWDSDKSIWWEISVPKEQVAEYVKIARENFLEPIPLVQSLGHSEWMFQKGANRDLAEYPPAPYAYSVTNPKTYEYIRRIYGEALDLFEPDFFHIGHDEVNIFGHYPRREEAKKWGETKLFTYDVQQHDKQMRPRNVRLMLWGDMLLHRSESSDSAANAPTTQEAKARRDAMPEDAVIADWHYQPAKPEDYKSLKIFKDAGFTTVACTWFNPDNIYSFAESARHYGAWGLLQTTWAGWTLTEQSMEREAKQFPAYILAAEYAWSGDSPPPDQLPYRADEVLARALNPEREITTGLPGVQIDLAKAANAAIAPNQWLNFAHDIGIDPTALKAPLAGVRFKCSDRAMVLKGSLLPRDADAPTRVELSMNLRAGTIFFLQATAFPTGPGQQVGVYTIHYADKSRERVELIYARNIRSWDDAAPTSQAAPALVRKTATGCDLVLRSFAWKNPHPEKPITRIVMETSHEYASPALFAATATTPAK
ncbi:MAG TPA: beta-N-acetylhexosaminidase [Tepidisphaeraceae bacterium]